MSPWIRPLHIAPRIAVCIARYVAFFIAVLMARSTGLALSSLGASRHVRRLFVVMAIAVSIALFIAFFIGTHIARP